MDLFDILYLYRVKNIGPVGFNFLTSHFNSIKDIKKHIIDTNKKWRGKTIIFPEDKHISMEIEETRKNGADFLTYKDTLYPNILKSYTYAPPIITYKGNINLLNKKILAVVGTRTPSKEGIEFCNYIIEKIQKKYVIASGFAHGIDYEAHMQSLNTGTIAALPCGINQIYPSNHSVLYENIAKNGLLITNLPFNTSPQKYFLLKRSELLVMISQGTIIIESTLNSGTMYTAQTTKEMNKPLFVVPGHPSNIKYKGNNQLIKNGAKILIDEEDIMIQDYNFQEKTTEILLDCTEEYKNDVWNFLKKDNHMDLKQIINKFGKHVLYSVLAELEIANLLSIVNNQVIIQT